MPPAAPALLWLLLGTPRANADDLCDSWSEYQQVYISEAGRVIDFRQDSVTTSEGQAYAMLRALWMNDRAPFDRVWTWTVANLQGGDPGRLPAWKWGKQEDGAFGVLDAQPASDADQLIIWSLLGASRRWQEPRYEEEAARLLDAFWAEEVMEVAGRLLVLPGPWARTQGPLRLNPSYLLPFVWRAFAAWDRSRPWGRMIDDGYAWLKACRGSTGLAKDWCYVDRETGGTLASPVPEHDNFGFEALRVPWTLAAEVKWHRERRAQRLLEPYLALASNEGAIRVPAMIGPDGFPRVDWEYPGMVAALVPAWSLRRPGLARRVWAAKIAPNRAPHGWGDLDDYYGQNWVWFGLALWQSKAVPL